LRPYTLCGTTIWHTTGYQWFWFKRICLNYVNHEGMIKGRDRGGVFVLLKKKSTSFEFPLKISI
jgi:hypothetical protein